RPAGREGRAGPRALAHGGVRVGALRARDRGRRGGAAGARRGRDASRGATALSAAPRAIGVGAGAYGLARATPLAEGRARGQIPGRYERAHPWAASGGTTRVLRYEYGPDVRFTAMVVQAAEAWRALGRRFGETLFVQCGVLHLASSKDVWEHESEL